MMKHSSLTPLPWITRYAGLIPGGGVVLDLACGSGRHTRYLLERQHRVVATDIDVSGLGDLAGDPRVNIIQADLENDAWPFDGEYFDGVVVANYLHRPHFRHLIDALTVNGVLLFDTFAVGNERFGHPRNPDYLLRDRELLDAFGVALNVKAYACGEVREPTPAIRQSICAVREA